MSPPAMAESTSVAHAIRTPRAAALAGSPFPCCSRLRLFSHGQRHEAPDLGLVVLSALVLLGVLLSMNEPDDVRLGAKARTLAWASVPE